MLNRTNRTLSANLNRLYLGTRSLVQNASETNGKLTLRARHALVEFPRDGMIWSHDASLIATRSRGPIPISPCSSPVDPRSVPGSEVDPVAVEPAVMPRPVSDPGFASCEPGQGGWDPFQPPAWSEHAAVAWTTKRPVARKRYSGLSRRLERDPGSAPARAARLTAVHATAGG